MRQELLLQNLLRIPNSALAVETSRRTTVADEVQSNLALLDDKTVVDTWLEQLEHLRVGALVADVVEDVTVGNDVQGEEEEQDGNVEIDVRDGGIDKIENLKDCKKVARERTD